jgi:hypothetical protein
MSCPYRYQIAQGDLQVAFSIHQRRNRTIAACHANQDDLYSDVERLRKNFKKIFTGRVRPKSEHDVLNHSLSRIGDDSSDKQESITSYDEVEQRTVSWNNKIG